MESFDNDYILMFNFNVKQHPPQVRKCMDDAKQKLHEVTAWVDLGKFIIQSYHLDTFCLTLSVGRTLKGL